MDSSTELQQGLARLAERFELSLDDRQFEQLTAYRDLLQRWNKAYNLVGDAADAALLSQHFGDCLRIAKALQPAPGERLVDLGSGAGLPGIVLKIVWPELHVMLVESNRKRLQFLEEAGRSLGLGELEVKGERAETLGQDPAYRARFDWATARRVAELAVLLEYALPLLKVGGRAMLPKGEGLNEELAAALGVSELLGGGAPRMVVVEQRRFVRIEKLSATPASYPRRPGRPQKKPLRPSDGERD